MGQISEHSRPLLSLDLFLLSLTRAFTGFFSERFLFLSLFCERQIWRSLAALQLGYEQLEDAHSNMKVRISLLALVFDVLHAQKEAAISAPLVISIIFVNSIVVALAALKIGCGQFFTPLHNSSIAASRPVMHERLFHRSRRVPHGYKGLSSMPSASFVPTTVLYDQVLLLKGPILEHSVRSRCKHTLVHSIAHSRRPCMLFGS
jgi:hypothetical protein